MRNMYKSAVCKPQENRARRRRSKKSEDNIRMNLSGMVYGDGNSIEFTNYRISY
jgi:hypothetical protein